MKKTDVAAIILVASISVMIAFAVASNISFLKVDSRGVEVDKADPISADVTSPSEEVFNKDALNPTVKTVIGGSQ